MVVRVRTPANDLGRGSVGHLARTGRPFRAEFTDPAMAQQPECIRLNKRPSVDLATGMLNDIVTSMAGALHMPEHRWVAIVPASARKNWPFAYPGPGRSLVRWT